MKAFLSHSNLDGDVVATIGKYLHDSGIDVWLDRWSLTPGDSLIERIGEGAESSDRLVVFLSPDSVESNWVKQEVENGLVMEFAKKSGLGEKFVIPVLLRACRIPFFLKGKVYANFTNKALAAACEELKRGILNSPLGVQPASFENGVVTARPINSIDGFRYALLVEFAVKISPTEGATVEVNVGGKYETDKVRAWFNRPDTAENPGMVSYQNSSDPVKNPPVYAMRFLRPQITSTHSYYMYFQGNEPLELKSYRFLDFYGEPV